MWIEVQVGTYGYSEGQLFSEDLSLHLSDGFPLPQGWTVGPYHDYRPVPRTNSLITTVINGGELLLSWFMTWRDIDAFTSL